jgi:hypothetical protein
MRVRLPSQSLRLRRAEVARVAMFSSVSAAVGAVVYPPRRERSTGPVFRNAP